MCLRLSIANYFLQSQEPSRVCQSLILKGAYQKVFSYLFKKRKIINDFPISQQITSLSVVSNMNTLLYSFLNLFCSSVVWFPTTKTKRLTSLKTITTWPPFYSTSFLQHIIFGAHYHKWTKKHHRTDVYSERSNNLLNIISYWLKGWRSTEYFINFMASFSDGSQRAVSWPSDIL